MKITVRSSCLPLWGLALLLAGCGGLERTNPLDPRNPASARPRVILLEAFVNDATPYSPFALAALDSLRPAYPLDQVIIVEHHLPSTKFHDPYALPESADRYRSLAAADHAVPDVLVNGSAIRLQGASRAATAALRYRTALQNELGRIAHFTIEAKQSFSAAGVAIEVAVARLGNSAFGPFALRALVWEDLALAGHHQVVRKVFAPQSFNGIAAGESKRVRFSAALPEVRDPGRVQAVVIVETGASLNKEVLQAVLAE
ncbi:MAG: hypothetical protein ONB48_20065 [candidate division KSB1 bacterium]|nr:hypothetical protein [candidate division KSB1 bacterium]MDZ7276251.1 hypothetical protein [candidate division KSB1 bacterium]MDZ7287943.1 hypothetical protein [candidate division KSB1 bacterium]MDZ7300044.1 hypothetical protein [candidate division KSB1 bacterium]MDZ7351046.1 hypothetical protein [candidate division KSB1 bacterium]